MKKIITNINLIKSAIVFKVPMRVILNEKEDDDTEVEITVVYDGKEYVGKGKDDLWLYAFVDLQKKLPKNIKIACCITCKHGNMCPFGDIPRELLCTKKLKISDKSDIVDLFDDKVFYENNKTLCDSYCNDYELQSDNYYTYSDYNYLVN